MPFKFDNRIKVIKDLRERGITLTRAFNTEHDAQDCPITISYQLGLKEVKELVEWFETQVIQQAEGDSIDLSDPQNIDYLEVSRRLCKLLPEDKVIRLISNVVRLYRAHYYDRTESLAKIDYHLEGWKGLWV